MDSSRDLQLLLIAIRDRAVDPGRLADAAAAWRGADGTGLMSFLAARGVISPDLLNRLEATTLDFAPAARDDFSLAPTPRAAPDGDATTDRPRGETPADGAAGARPRTRGSSRYEVLRLHQAGGLGQVWLARDTAVGREVALKTIRPERAGAEDARLRFVREARVTGRLEHPCVVPLYDLGGGEAEPYYVMRFVSGKTLTEASAAYHRRRAEGRAGPLELNGLLDAFVGVCRAVAFAHSRGVLHRDLKGQNVVVGDFGEVFLLDWGLAKVVGEADTPPAAGGAAGGDGELTLPGAAVGTPAFMAPEVAADGTTTTASDVYGLGAILYSLLAGRPPYTGTTQEVMARLASATPPPAVSEFNAAAPAALVAVCRKAMAANPADRYASAEELATDVRRFLADEPVSAYREPWPAWAARWARRRRTAVVAAAVLVATAAVASTAAAGLLYREEQKTEAERAKAARNAAAAVEVARDLTTYVEAQEMGTAAAPATEAERRERLDVALASYEHLLELQPDDPTVRRSVARLHRMRANLYRFLDKTAEAERSYHESVRLFSALADDFPDNPEFRESAGLARRDYGLLLQRLGRDREAAAIAEETVARYEEWHKARPDVPNHARLLAYSLLARSDREHQLGRLAESERDARRAAELYEKVAATPDPRPELLDPLFRATAEHNVAVALRDRGEFEKAVEAHDAAVNRMAALAKLTNSRDVASFHQRARVERAWTLGNKPGQSAGGIHSAAADLDQAIRAWDALNRQWGENPTDLHRKALAGLYAGRLRVRLGQRGGATKSVAAAAAVLEKLAAGQLLRPAYHHDLGRAYTALGDLADSRDAGEYYRKARASLGEALRLYPENAQYRKALGELDAAERRR